MRIVPKSFAFTALLGLFAALPALSIDLSALTLPLLPRALGTSGTVAGLTLSLFMAGFALGQLGGGILSDDRGRRPVLLGGLACFTVAGAACALSVSGEVLAIARLVQGFGAGTCSVIAFAMVQDLFDGDAARAKRSYMISILGAAPILAPALGAVVIDWFGWRSVHGILAAAGGLLLAITWICVAESRSTGGTAPPPHPVPLLHDVRFIQLSLANALSYGAIFVYIAGSPVIIIDQMGLSPAAFAGLFACTAAALSAGAITSGRLGRLGVGAAALVNSSLIAAAAATLALAIGSLLGVTSGGLLVPLLLAVLFARGMIAPNLQHLAIERQPERAGRASAIVGVSQLLSGALASAAVAFLIPSFGLSAVGVPMAVLAMAALMAWRWSCRYGTN